MFEEEIYRSMNEQIAPSQALTAQVLAGPKSAGKRFTLRFRRQACRRIGFAAALILSFCFAVPALAVHSPSGYQLVYAVSPAVAQFFIPVQESCTSDGIRMEVVSAYVHGDTAEIYVSMQDLTGERIDASMDLFDSETLHVPFDNIGTCRQISYDAETKTATFLIQISSMDGSDIKGGKTTFSISCFLSHTLKMENVPLVIDWSKATDAAETVMLERPLDGQTLVNEAGESFTIPPCHSVLKPTEPIATLLDGFDVTGLGFVDGKLHIQLYTPGRRRFDDHAFLELSDAQGSKIPAVLVYHDSVDEQTGRYPDYIDYVFDVQAASLNDYTLFGSFYAAKLRTEGNWQVTFPLQTSEG